MREQRVGKLAQSRVSAFASLIGVPLSYAQPLSITYQGGGVRDRSAREGGCVCRTPRSGTCACIRWLGSSLRARLSLRKELAAPAADGRWQSVPSTRARARRSVRVEPRSRVSVTPRCSRETEGDGSGGERAEPGEGQVREDGSPELGRESQDSRHWMRSR